MNKIILSLVLLFVGLSAIAQINIEGYVYESGNRGFIHDAEIALTESGKTDIITQTTTDRTGKYVMSIPEAGRYDLYIIKKPYFESVETMDIEASESKLYFKHEVMRQPGYIFDITLAEKDATPDTPRDGLKGALIEVYNNTLQKEEFVIPSLQDPDFQIDLLKGNHYTILIRKEGFLSKRMEAFVDVEGCILCFEGVGRVEPGVSDNLTSENRTGTLLANVEMDRYFTDKIIGLNNIYYDYSKSDITDRAAQELTKVGVFLKDNPNLVVELGSHTDARGKANKNLKLSQARAQSAANYLIENEGVDRNFLTYRGYGEVDPVNKCKDGVDCTEAEHSLNRRTELRIVSFVDFSQSKSLREMKTEEIMEQLLSGQGETQEIRVAAGDELENVIKQLDSNRLTQTRTFRNADGSSSPATRTAPTRQAPVVQTPSAQVPETPTSVPVAIEKTSEVVEKINIVESPAEVKVQEVIPVQEEEQIQEVLEIREEVPPVQEVRETQEVVETAESVSSEASAATKSTAGEYSGYQIALHSSRFQLPIDHKIFDDYPEVIIYQATDRNYLYLIGDYINKGVARRALNQIKDAYGDAFLIGFENGVRVE